MRKGRERRFELGCGVAASSGLLLRSLCGCTEASSYGDRPGAFLAPHAPLRSLSPSPSPSSRCPRSPSAVAAAALCSEVTWIWRHNGCGPCEGLWFRCRRGEDIHQRNTRGERFSCCCCSFSCGVVVLVLSLSLALSPLLVKQ